MFVKMIRSGINVLITTHSPYLLEQLGQYVRADKLDPNARAKVGFDKDDYLKQDEISPHMFKRNGEGDHSIMPVDINDESGISQEAFVKTDEALYDRSLAIQINTGT